MQTGEGVGVVAVNINDNNWKTAVGKLIHVIAQVYIQSVCKCMYVHPTLRRIDRKTA